MRKKIFTFVSLLSFLLLFAACSGARTRKNVVTVTILPQQYFAEQIAGDKFEIHTMVPAGSSPETFDPSPSSLVKVSDSKAYFKIGHIGFELGWMEKLKQNNPDMLVFDNSDGIDLLESNHECSHEGHHHAGHGSGIDPHTWTTPRNAAQIATNMLAAFIQLDPENETYYRTNYDQLMERIAATSDSLEVILKDLPSRDFVIYHPSLTYFANDYGLRQHAIENDGKEPSAQYLKQLIDTVRASGAQVIFIQQEFDTKNAKLLAQETGGEVVSINPLNYDWNQELIEIAKALHGK